MLTNTPFVRWYKRCRVIMSGANIRTADGATCAPMPVRTATAFLLVLVLVHPTFATGLAGLAYVTNCNDNTVSSYDVDGATGQLENVRDVATGKCPLSITVHPSGKFVYVQNAGADSLSLYSVDAATSTLTAVATVPTGRGRSPGRVTVHPSGKFLYVGNHDSNTISAYSIDPLTGALTSLGGSPFATDARPGSLSVHPGGRFLYTANFDADSISGYTINPTTGALTPIPGSPFAAAANPMAIAIHPSGKFTYVANWGSHDISVYQTNIKNGALQEVLPRVSAGIKPASIAIRSGFVYVANMRSHDIATYRIDATTGALQEVMPRVKMAGWPEVIALYPFKRSIYATSYQGDEFLVLGFAINEATGALSRGSIVRQGKLNRRSASSAIALSPRATPQLAQGAVRVLFQGPAAPVHVELILDASNSMWGRSEGRRKIDLAKDALTSVIQGLPSTSQVAMRVYGHRYRRQLKNCQDSAVLVPFGPLDKAKLTEQVQAITPRGMTPLAYSLKQVLNDFGDAPGEKLVIVVTDGNETCGGDPVAVAKALRRQRADVRIEVIGVAITDVATKRRLRTIAALTRGRYYAAKDAPELKAALAVALRLAFSVEDQRGMRVAHGMVGGERLCLVPGNYRITVRNPTHTFAFDNIAIAPGQQTRLTLIPQDQALGKVSRSEALTQPCPVPAQPSPLAEGAHTPELSRAGVDASGN